MVTRKLACIFGCRPEVSLAKLRTVCKDRADCELNQQQ
jgi:hypothetical protein